MVDDVDTLADETPERDFLGVVILTGVLATFSIKVVNRLVDGVDTLAKEEQELDLMIIYIKCTKCS